MTVDTEPAQHTLTARQRQIIGVIAAYADEHGMPPTVREIRVACGIGSTSTVAHHLHRLAAAGWLSWQPGRARSIRLSWQAPTPNAREVVLAAFAAWPVIHLYREDGYDLLADTAVDALSQAGLLR